MDVAIFVGISLQEKYFAYLKVEVTYTYTKKVYFLANLSKLRARMIFEDFQAETVDKSLVYFSCCIMHVLDHKTTICLLSCYIMHFYRNFLF